MRMNFKGSIIFPMNWNSATILWYHKIQFVISQNSDEFVISQNEFVISQNRICDITKSLGICDITNSILWYHKIAAEFQFEYPQSMYLRNFLFLLKTEIVGTH